MYKKYFKFLFDYFTIFLISPIIIPIFLIISIFLLIVNRGKIFYLQLRLGKYEKPFYLIKFRSMNDEYDDQGKLTPDHLRITKIGKFLRYFSIDELPNIINVLKGDMSLVGPRPYPVKYRDIFSNYQKKRFIVRPGITGLAQINGRNKLNWYSKTEYDLQYIEKLSFLSDLAIIFRTFFIFAGKHSDPNFDGQSFDTYLPRINGEDL